MSRRQSYILALAFLVAGCAGHRTIGVKPYQHAWLAERCMAPGIGDRSEIKFRQHWEGSRQGAEGGFGTAGGGCGCN